MIWVISKVIFDLTLGGIAHVRDGDDVFVDDEGNDWKLREGEYMI